MLEEINSRLVQVIEQKRLKDKLASDLRAVEREYHDQAARLETLAAQLSKEKVDVDKLERLSLTALFYSVLGSKDQQLEKERQEMLSTQLKFQQVKHQVEYLERERDRLLDRMDNLKEVDSAYESLLAEKERVLRQSNQPAGEQLVSISEQAAHLGSEVKEISEAIAAGEQAVDGLDQVLKSLESARDWGTWDLIGGGFLSTAIKHSRIDDARDMVHEVQTQMSRFKRELADVQLDNQLAVNLGAFESFADYFFDGLIIDWIVQSEVLDSINRSKQVREAISKALSELEKAQKTSQDRLAGLQMERERLLSDI
jgi:chromosome segregation ATPase